MLPGYTLGVIFSCLPVVLGWKEKKHPWGRDAGRGEKLLEAPPDWGQEMPLSPGPVVWITSGAWVVAGIARVSPPLQIHSGVPVFQEEEPVGIAFDSELTANAYLAWARVLSPL